jgi:hypothetical protein
LESRYFGDLLKSESPFLLKKIKTKFALVFADAYPCGMLKIDYTIHSLMRLDERGISHLEVEEAIQFGEKSDTPSGLRRSMHRNQKGTLAVIYRIQGPEEVLMITAYWE